MLIKYYIKTDILLWYEVKILTSFEEMLKEAQILGFLGFYDNGGGIVHLWRRAGWVVGSRRVGIRDWARRTACFIRERGHIIRSEKVHSVVPSPFCPSVRKPDLKNKFKLNSDSFILIQSFLLLQSSSTKHSNFQLSFMK